MFNQVTNITRWVFSTGSSIQKQKTKKNSSIKIIYSKKPSPVSRTVIRVQIPTKKTNNEW